jgi:hypothetical protein
MANQSSILPAHVLRELAVAADTDPRTVAKYVAGEAVKALCAKRIERALRINGLERLRSTTPGDAK